MTTTDEQPGYADASIRQITAENGIEYAYHDLGAGGVPLVLLQHFRGNLDNWDPALIDDLAAARRVVTFDNRGVGGTTGVTPDTIEAIAHDAIAFVEAMNLNKVDLLGFSIGHRSPGFRRERRQRPDDPASLLVPANPGSCPMRG